MSTPALCLHDLGFAYPGAAAPVLRGVNLDVSPGELVSVVGPNGGGKTTLLRLVMGELDPGSGSVRVLGLPPKLARARLGYLPQHLQFDPLFPVTARQVVLMALAQPGFHTRQQRAGAEAAMETAAVADLADNPLAHLSGGQRQRVLLARALARDPEVLLLDEPTASMDPANARLLHESLSRLHGKVACLLVSHDLEFVTALARRVVCVHREVEVHPTEEFKGGHAEQLFGTPLRRVSHEQVLPEPEHHHG